MELSTRKSPGRSRQLLYEIHDLYKKYNATIKAYRGFVVVIDIPGDEQILLMPRQRKAIARVGSAAARRRK